jgi:predicted nucleic acid-binding Zn ribbon protein
MENKHCLQCAAPLKGRRDKKFCDDHCRNNYNNQLHLNTTLMMRQVHQILRKNRRILEKALIQNEAGEPILLEPLLEEGFLPGYHTKFSHDANGQLQYYCYEFGFKLVDQYIIIQLNQTSKAA